MLSGTRHSNQMVSDSTYLLVAFKFAVTAREIQFDMNVIFRSA